jgi:methyl-accepting chemotaxis protein/methyl-accepting chemotaxis protein-1 (serine sensor receptor)
MAAALHDRARASAEMQRFQQRTEQMEKVLAEVKPLIETDRGRAMVQTLESQTQQWGSQSAKLAQLTDAGNAAEAAKLVFEKVTPIGDAIDVAADNFLELQKNFFKDSVDQGRQKAASARTIAWSLLVLALALVPVILLVLRNATGLIRQVALELAEGSSETAHAAAQIASASQALAQGSSQQAASLEETSASSEEITSMTRKNAENSRQAAEVMQTVDARVKEGNQTLHEMVGSMEEINQSSSKISRIIKVIDEIAFQTNILALNAAVEAARAGEAGMGFAVVAEEVRNLAQRSAQAAKDTSTLIEESISKSHGGSGKLEQVAAVIHAITESATQVKTLVDEVNLGSQEQAHGIEQISRAIVQMEQVTQSSAANAEESASASEELSSQAAAMQTMVARLLSLVGGQGSAQAPPVEAAKPQPVPVRSAVAPRRKSAAPASEKEHGFMEM